MKVGEGKFIIKRNYINVGTEENPQWEIAEDEETKKAREWFIKKCVKDVGELTRTPKNDEVRE